MTNVAKKILDLGLNLSSKNISRVVFLRSSRERSFLTVMCFLPHINAKKRSRYKHPMLMLKNVVVSIRNLHTPYVRGKIHGDI